MDIPKLALESEELVSKGFHMQVKYRYYWLQA
jgi:hypothetical protein